ncbi:MAG: choice-of-anchor Q domain-containing protein, partial [Sulfurimonas sp.]|nr:choice-of-anchor Q domain-containing protein [Sulfurimonas sp.]
MNYFGSNNIYDGVTLGFVNEANGDYNLTASSDLIDAGTTTITGITLPTTDLNGNARIVGGSIDIGPYEFSTTRPTINSITYTGVAKEQSTLTINVDYTLADGRTLESVEYDYLNNGTYTTSNTYTFNSTGTYKVNVKITDSAGEFSSSSLSVTVAPLAFADMTDEQKLIKAIDPVYYDAVVAIIEESKTASNTSGYELGLYDGKEYVKNNPAAFSLLTQAEANASVGDAVQAVINNPSNYGLVSQTESNASIAASYESGKQYVLNNLAQFELITYTEKVLAESNAEEAGKTYVQTNPAEFNLVTAADAAIQVTTATTAATAAGIVTGKTYVQTNPAEFHLVTAADAATQVTTATTAAT